MIVSGRYVRELWVGMEACPANSVTGESRGVCGMWVGMWNSVTEESWVVCGMRVGMWRAVSA